MSKTKKNIEELPETIYKPEDLEEIKKHSLNNYKEE